MTPLEAPIAFEPLYQERVWGGRSLGELGTRRLPDERNSYGESWELSDREDEKAQSVVRSGPEGFRGLTLHELWTRHRERVFGTAYAEHPAPRFPILAKILDARDRLSIQVHPPADKAGALGGEAKTEMWYIVRAAPGAKLYVGLRAGVDAARFEEAIHAGTVEEQVHTIEPRPGQFLHIPSGRLHAIGAGLLLYEIQQNSDTTYRVYDWNRAGQDGCLRPLHVAEALQCIDFTDVTPSMSPAAGELLVDCPFFRVECWRLARQTTRATSPGGTFAMVSVIDGEVRSGAARFQSGDFFLVPAAAAAEVRALRPEGGPASVLVTTLPIPSA